MTALNLALLKTRMLHSETDHVPFGWIPSGNHWVVTYALAVNDHIKIGKTRNLRARWSNLQTANPGTMVMIGAVQGDHERRAHWTVERAGWPRVSGEWFEDGWIYERVWEDAVHLRDVLYDLGLCWRVAVGTMVEMFDRVEREGRF